MMGDDDAIPQFHNTFSPRNSKNILMRPDPGRPLPYDPTLLFSDSGGSGSSQRTVS